MALEDQERKRRAAQSQKRYKASEKGKATQARFYRSKAKREESKRWRTKNKWKVVCHRLTHKAIKAKRLLRKPCAVCQIHLAFAHHDDYTKPLSVKWLCALHHVRYHKGTLTKEELACANACSL